MLAAAVAGFFILQTAAFSQPQTGKCGDGICGPVEREKGGCPQDCSRSEVLAPALIRTSATSGFLIFI